MKNNKRLSCIIKFKKSIIELLEYFLQIFEKTAKNAVEIISNGHWSKSYYYFNLIIEQLSSLVYQQWIFYTVNNV